MLDVTELIGFGASTPPPLLYRSSTNGVTVGAGIVTINVPSGVVNGDLLLLLTASVTNYPSEPAGFTRLTLTPFEGTTYFGISAYRIASSEPASYNISFVGTGEARMIALYGPAVLALQASGAVDTGASTSATANSVTASAAGTLLQILFDRDAAQTPTPDGSMTTLVNTGGSFFGANLAKQAIASGATGSKTMTNLNAANAGFTHLLAVNH
jgi:hypothetical protein